MKISISLFVFAFALSFAGQTFGQVDSDSAARAQAALDAKPGSATQPANKSVRSSGVVESKSTTSLPAKAIPKIAGNWQCDDNFLTIVQTDGKWSTTYSYTTAKKEDVAWEITDGVITPDGKLSGKLHFTKEPKNWGEYAEFHARRAHDGKTITGPIWENHGGKFEWTATDPNIPLEILVAMAKHELAVGMTLEQCNIG